jgi:hypothetical protein
LLVRPVRRPFRKEVRKTVDETLVMLLLPMEAEVAQHASDQSECKKLLDSCEARGAG